MSYKVLVARSAERDRLRLSPITRDRTDRALRSLIHDPRPRGTRKLSNGPGWRLRVGDYRILYIVDDSQQVVTIYAISHRRDAYRH